PRPTVILTKIANAFIESGLTDDARVFLQKAVTLSPNGASRARQSLAKLALASDDPALAERYARESLLMGRFQAKTIPAWQLYLDARARQNLTPLLEPDVFASFQSNATARIASGSLHSIIRLLRTHGDPTWKAIAESAIASPKADPIISTEVEKIIQADAKLTGSEEARTTAARALRMFRSNNASAQEQVAHAKCYVRYSLVNDQIPSLDSILTPANKRFGRDHADTVLHAMALGAMQAGKHDTARKWLMNLLSLVVPGSDSWGKAMWAQARMESLLGKCSEAAAIYFQISSSVEIPPRFRMQSMLLGFKNLAASGDIVNLDELSVSVRNLLAGVSDYRVAFDAARQLALAGSPLGGLRGEAAAKGAVLADQALTKASNPAARLAILEFVARRQFWDLGDTNAILEAWSGLTDLQKSEMRIHGGSVWYQYCSIVMQSMVKMGKTYEAQALVSSIVDESHATSEGYVIMGSAYAEWLLSLGEKDKAFTYFQWISIEAPTHLSAASAHYWLSLRYLNAGQPTASFTSAKAVRLCFGAAPSLLSEWELDAKALLILTNLSEDAAINQGRDRFTPAFIHQMLATLRSDRDSIR
ncbi:MAG: hypothetical protein ORN51_07250, partial [Akkermansiaceae bacterium]|nr:hypothetical protein [Akkermansiaceae bacterium]